MHCLFPTRITTLIILAVSVVLLPATAQAKTETWMADYGQAVSAAKAEKRMLLILFQDPGQKELNRYVEAEVFGAKELTEKLADFACVRLPVDAKVRSGGREITVLDHEAFAGLQKGPGIAILDFAHSRVGYYGLVVSALSVSNKKDVSADKLGVLLGLPPGARAARAKVFRSRWLAKQIEKEAGPPLSWLEDYSKGVEQAKREGKMLLVVFCSPEGALQCDCLCEGVLGNPEVRVRMKELVRVRVPLDARIKKDGKNVKLVEQPGFSEMGRRQGMAIIDFAHKGAPYYGQVVSCFPILDGRLYDVRKTLVILDLPPGKLTQRTLIYAVRIHPEHPASTEGDLRTDLLEEAESHSIHQASIRLQGHHNWESRFHRINGKLRGGMMATEVCAESWPGEGLLRAAIECVRCWRLSSGHWRAVSGRHRCYGYDMRRGSNGIWYATGIFGGRQ
jgi:hypothetical protein